MWSKEVQCSVRSNFKLAVFHRNWDFSIQFSDFIHYIILSIIWKLFISLQHGFNVWQTIYSRISVKKKIDFFFTSMCRPGIWYMHNNKSVYVYSGNRCPREPAGTRFWMIRWFFIIVQITLATTLTTIFVSSSAHEKRAWNFSFLILNASMVREHRL